MEHTTTTATTHLRRFFLPANAKQSLRSFFFMMSLWIGSGFVISYFAIDTTGPAGRLFNVIVWISLFGMAYFGIRTLTFHKKESEAEKRYVDNLPEVSFDSTAAGSTERFIDFTSQNGYTYLPKPDPEQVSDIQQTALFDKGVPTFRIEGVYKQHSFSMTALQRPTRRNVIFWGVIRVSVSGSFLKNSVREAFERSIEHISSINKVEYDSYAVYIYRVDGIPSNRAQMLKLFEIIERVVVTDQAAKG